MNKAVSLVRVSTEAQADQDRAGIPRQREVNQQTAKRFGLQIVEEIVLVDVSGTSVLAAPETKHLLEVIKDPSIEGVVVAELSRIFRPDNFEDFGLLQRYKESGAKIFLPDGSIDLNSQSGYLLGGVKSLISGYELATIKARMLGAKEAKRKAGLHPNALITLPRGCSFDYHSGKFFYTEDSEKVRLAFELICNDGIANLRELARRTGIHHRTLANTLRNEIWIGYRTYNQKRGAEKYSRPGGRQADRKKVYRAPDEIIRVKVIEKPLVSEKTFYKAQALLAEKRRLYQQKRNVSPGRFLYSGLLYCQCGQPMYSFSGETIGRKDYYYCRSHHYLARRKETAVCGSRWHSRREVDFVLDCFVGDYLVAPRVLERLIRTDSAEPAASGTQNRIQTLEGQVAKMKEKRGRLLDLYLDGGFSKEQLNERVVAIDAELRLHLQMLDEFRIRQSALESQDSKKLALRLLTTLSEYRFLGAEEKRNILSAFMPKICLNNEGEITGFDLGTSHTVRTRTGKGMLAINGKAWPHTERLTYMLGETIHWRWVNPSANDHPLHLHGSYFRVDGVGDGAADKIYTEEERRLVVTHRMEIGGTMAMTWVPERHGRWLFHCHIASHMEPEFRAFDAAKDTAPHLHSNESAGMGGLVMGIEVLPGVKAAQPTEPAPPRTVRLLVRERPAWEGLAPARVFQLQEGPEVPPIEKATIPGPPLILTRGQQFEITVANHMREATSVHWHGIELDSYYDGVPGWGGALRQVTPPIGPGESFVAKFAPPRAGTFIYHTHWHHTLQLGTGLYGPLIVLEPGQNWGPQTDKIFLISSGGPDDLQAPTLLNGQAQPSPLVLKAGTKYRFRFINISLEAAGAQVSLLAGGAPVRWRAVAKDGADVPQAQAVEQEARQVVSVGETYDFEFQPATKADLRLEVRRPLRRTLLVGEVLVR